MDVPKGPLWSWCLGAATVSASVAGAPGFWPRVALPSPLQRRDAGSLREPCAAGRPPAGRTWPPRHRRRGSRGLRPHGRHACSSVPDLLHHGRWRSAPPLFGSLRPLACTAAGGEEREGEGKNELGFLGVPGRCPFFFIGPGGTGAVGSHPAALSGRPSHGPNGPVRGDHFPGPGPGF